MRPYGLDKVKGMNVGDKIVEWIHITSFVLQQNWFVLLVTNLSQKGVYYQELM